MQLKREELKRQLLRGFSVTFLGNCISQLLGLALILALTRYLAPSESGLIFIVIATVRVIVAFVDIRIGEAITKFGMEYLAKGDKARALSVIVLGYVIDFSLGAMCFAIIFFAAPYIAAFKGEPTLGGLLRIYAFACFLRTTNDTSDSTLKIFKRFKTLSLLAIWRSSLRFLIPFIFIVQGESIERIMIGFTIAAVLNASAHLGVALLTIKRNFAGVRPVGIKDDLKRIVPFSLQTFLAATFKAASRDMDVFILGILTTPADVSYYKIALTLASTLTYLAMPVSYVIYPTLSELWAVRDKETFRRLLIKVTKGLALICLAAGALLMIFSPTLVKLWNADYFDAAGSAMTLSILVLVFFIETTTCWLRPAVLSIERPEISAQLNFLRMLIIIIGSMVLVPHLGYVGMAWVYLILSVTTIGLGIFKLDRAVKLSSAPAM